MKLWLIANFIDIYFNASGKKRANKLGSCFSNKKMKE